MPATAISLSNAKSDKLFYLVANVVVYRASDGRCLILKRSEREIAHPGKYGVIGGKLEWSDLDINKPTRIHGEVLDYQEAIETLLAREAKEEAGITIEKELHYINSVAYIRPDGVPSLLVKFAAQYKSGKIILEKESFSEFAWVNTDEVSDYPCMEGIADEVARTIQLFSNK